MTETISTSKEFIQGAIHDLVRWMDSHLGQALTVTEIAKRYGTTDRTLSMHFKMVTGMSLGRYIRRRKLTLASLILRMTNRDITEIGLMYGYDSLQSFSRAFRTMFGQSPSDYRKAIFWDMLLYQPSAVPNDFCYSFSIVNIPIGYTLDGEKEIYQISIGFDFIPQVDTHDMKSDPSLSELLTELLQRQYKGMWGIVGQILPAEEEGKDAIIELISGKFKKDMSSKLTAIPAGEYACFSYEGSLQECVAIQIWVSGHGMHLEQCVLLKGTHFTKIIQENCIFKVQYYLPILR